MASIWQEHRRQELLTRLERLTEGSEARWGKFHCSAMLAHVNDAIRMALGEVTPAAKKLPIRFFPLKQLIIYALPFPKGAPTAPALLARGNAAIFRDEVQAFQQLLARLAKHPEQPSWPPHPAFGPMNRRSWGVLGYKHIDHHFTQFGV